MPETITIDTEILLKILTILSIVLLLFLFPSLIRWGVVTLVSPQIKEAYQKIFAPYYPQIVSAFVLSFGDLLLLISAKSI